MPIDMDGDVKCVNCGRPRREHVIVEYAGAPLRYTPYICPTSTFAAPEAIKPRGREKT